MSVWMCRYQNTTPLKAGMVVSNEPGAVIFHSQLLVLTVYGIRFSNSCNAIAMMGPISDHRLCWSLHPSMLEGFSLERR